MKFYDWALAKQVMRSSDDSWRQLTRLPLQEWCQRVLPRLQQTIQEAEGAQPQLAATYWHILFDKQWDRVKRPYFNLWPEVFKQTNGVAGAVLSGTKLHTLAPAFDTVLFRLPLGTQELFADDGGDPTLTVSCLRVSLLREEQRSLLVMETQSRTLTAGPNTPENHYVYLQELLTPEVTLADFVQRLRAQGEQANQSVERWVRCLYLWGTAMQLANDPQVTMPDVLDKDAQRYVATRDLEYVQRAHRRGKVGWHIGYYPEQDHALSKSK